MSQLQRFFADAAQRASLGRAIPDGTIVRFDLIGPGGGTWSLVSHGGQVRLLDRPHPSPDCLLRCAASDFVSLVNGRLDPRQGFMDGRLVVVGDVGIVLNLRRAIRGGP